MNFYYYLSSVDQPKSSHDADPGFVELRILDWPEFGGHKFLDKPGDLSGVARTEQLKFQGWKPLGTGQLDKIYQWRHGSIVALAGGRFHGDPRGEA